MGTLFQHTYHLVEHRLKTLLNVKYAISNTIACFHSVAVVHLTIRKMLIWHWHLLEFLCTYVYGIIQVSIFILMETGCLHCLTSHRAKQSNQEIISEATFSIKKIPNGSVFIRKLHKNIKHDTNLKRNFFNFNNVAQGLRSLLHMQK